MQPLTDAKLSVECKPVEQKEKQKGLGEFAVCFNNQKEWIPSDLSYRMSRCADMGLQLALADALRELNPNHPLLNTWHLMPDNRNKLAKYQAKD